MWFIGGYYHAQRRIKKGLLPLAYHRVSLSTARSNICTLKAISGYYHDRNASASTLRSRINSPFTKSRRSVDTTYDWIRRLVCISSSKFSPCIEADNTVYNHNQFPRPIYQPPQAASKINPVLGYDVPPLGPPPQRSSSKVRQENGVLETPTPTARSSRSPWAGRLDTFIR